MPAPTPEQSAAVDTFRRGDHLVLQAGAGTGKTTTLAMLAAGTTKPGRYIAFNKSIANDAAHKFPSNVKCKTAHSLAFGAVGHRYGARMNAPRLPGWKTGASLGIAVNMRIRIGERNVTNKALSYTVLRTVTRFCQSADRTIQRHHVPRLRGIEAEHLHAQLVDVVLPYANRAWEDLQNPQEGVVRFDHDHCLKIWALTEPRIEADFLLLDEAQDTNPVVEKIFNSQRDHTQLVMVGDSAQAIYGWRGARDVMSGFDGTQLALSQSFRFGSALAEEANRWLHIVDSPIRLTGTPAIDTRLDRVQEPDAILCRSNVGAMLEVMHLLEEGRRVALVGGGRVSAGPRPSRPRPQSRQAQRPPRADPLRLLGRAPGIRRIRPVGPWPLVDLVDEHGVDVILDAVDRLSVEQGAEIVVSTAHKAKGREWAFVRIGEDFTEPMNQEETDENGDPLPGDIDDAEARLAYVAVTRARARHRLDIGGLGWINQHPDGNPGRTHPRQDRAGSG